MNCDHSRLFCPVKRFKTKRQQAIADREQELLVLAECMIQEQGISNLTMDKLVAASDYSKGTVYNHFSSKEDLFCALCVKCMRLLLSRFSRINLFEGHTREKVLACHYAYRLHVLMNPTLFATTILSQSPAVQEKCSKERLDEYRKLDQQATAFIDELHKEAVNRGELRVSIGVSVNSLVFASWAMSFGTNSLLAVGTNMETIQRLEMDNTLLINTSLLMDGMGWEPLSAEFDYQQTWDRIGREVFADELQELQKVKLNELENSGLKNSSAERDETGTK